MQKKRVVAVLTVVGALLLSSVPMFAQAAGSNTASETDIKLLREDIRSERKRLVAWWTQDGGRKQVSLTQTLLRGRCIRQVRRRDFDFVPSVLGRLLFPSLYPLGNFSCQSRMRTLEPTVQRVRSQRCY